MAETTSSTDKQGMSVPLAIVVAGAVIAAAVYFRPGTSPSSGGLAERAAGQPAATVAGVPDAKVEVPIDANDPILGSATAPVTLVEFTDFECPFCQRYHETTFPRLKTEYVDTGKVRYVVKHFPLMQIHPRAEAAGIAAQCAHQQGKFFEYTDQLFDHQQALSDNNLASYAETLGLDVTRFEDCVSAGETSEIVAHDQQAGITAGVTGTPGFFINGRRLDGAQPYEQFQALIEEELK